MRKLISSALLVFLFCACSNNSLLEEPEQPTAEQDTTFRTKQEAIELAQQYANAFTTDDTHSRNSQRTVNKSGVHAIYGKSSRGYAEYVGVPLMYIVDYNDENGYAIISTPKEAEPVLAIIDSGSYNDSIANSIPGFKYFMDAATEYVYSFATQGMPGGGGITIIDPVDPNPDGPLPITEQKIDYDTLACFVRKPRNPFAKRGQDFPEGDLCPNKVSGCGPTAILMVCEHFSEPASFTLTYDKSNETVLLDWDNIHWKSSVSRSMNQILGYELDDVYLPIAKFARQIGHIADADYKSTGSTGVKRSNMPKAMKKILPNRQVAVIEKANTGNVSDLFWRHGILICEGNRVSDDAGHAWVADGIDYLHTAQTVSHRKQGESTWTIIDTSYYERLYLHHDFGWNGVSNGNFLWNVVLSTKNGDFKNDLQYISIQ